MRRRITLILVTLTVACAPQLVWYKPGSSQADFNKDRYDCYREAFGYAPPSNVATGVVTGAGWANIYTADANAGARATLLDQCLQARGWSLIQRASLPAAPEGASVLLGAPEPGSVPAQVKTPEDTYNFAFGLLRAANYPAAEQALRVFLQRYPNDPLAGNALYWLAETYYVRGDYRNAATAFAEDYRKYPSGGKGADSLLKLAMSLTYLGQNGDACTALIEIGKAFPNASANIAERTGTERRRLGC
jgi:tol-pal system protein YbgF